MEFKGRKWWWRSGGNRQGWMDKEGVVLRTCQASEVKTSFLRARETWMGLSKEVVWSDVGFSRMTLGGVENVFERQNRDPVRRLLETQRWKVILTDQGAWVTRATKINHPALGTGTNQTRCWSQGTFQSSLWGQAWWYLDSEKCMKGRRGKALLYLRGEEGCCFVR